MIRIGSCTAGSANDVETFKKNEILINQTLETDFESQNEVYAQNSTFLKSVEVANQIIFRNVQVHSSAESLHGGMDAEDSSMEILAVNTDADLINTKVTTMVSSSHGSIRWINSSDCKASMANKVKAYHHVALNHVKASNVTSLHGDIQAENSDV